MPLFNLARGFQLNFEVTPGPLESSPLAILSGPLSSSLAIWDDFVPLLTEAGFQVLRFDHPGHGKSTCPDDVVANITFPAMADDIQELISYVSSDAAEPGERVKLPVVAWVGISMGAALGVFHAIAYPQTTRNLVLADTISCAPRHAGAPDLFTERVAAARKDGGMGPTLEATLDRWYGNRLLPEARRKQMAIMSPTSLNGFEACCAALVHNSFDIRPLACRLAESVADDVIVVVGSLDADLPKTMTELAKSIEQGYRRHGKKDYTVPIKIIPESGHVPVVDNLKLFVAAVMPFLTEKI